MSKSNWIYSWSIAVLGLALSAEAYGQNKYQLYFKVDTTYRTFAVQPIFGSTVVSMGSSTATSSGVYSMEQGFDVSKKALTNIYQMPSYSSSNGPIAQHLYSQSTNNIEIERTVLKAWVMGKDLQSQKISRVRAIEVDLSNGNRNDVSQYVEASINPANRAEIIVNKLKGKNYMCTGSYCDIIPFGYNFSLAFRQLVLEATLSTGEVVNLYVNFRGE